MKQDKEFYGYVKMKYHMINHRCKHKKSYIDKDIQNRFTFTEFYKFACDNHLQRGQHCHRPDRFGDYCHGNLVFLTEDEHRRISRQEQRKLDDDQVKQIRRNQDGLSTRKLATIFGVSHQTIHNIQTGKTYKELMVGSN